MHLILEYLFLSFSSYFSILPFVYFCTSVASILAKEATEEKLNELGKKGDVIQNFQYKRQLHIFLQMRCGNICCCYFRSCLGEYVPVTWPSFV